MADVWTDVWSGRRADVGKWKSGRTSGSDVCTTSGPDVCATSGPNVFQTSEIGSLGGRLDQTSKQMSGPDVLADVSIKMSMRCSIKPKPILPEDGTEV